MRKRLGEKLKSIFQDPKVRDDLTTAKNGVMTALALAERIASNFPPAAMALGGVLEVLDGIDVRSSTLVFIYSGSKQRAAYLENCRKRADPERDPG